MRQEKKRKERKEREMNRPRRVTESTGQTRKHRLSHLGEDWSCCIVVEIKRSVPNNIFNGDGEVGRLAFNLHGQ